MVPLAFGNLEGQVAMKHARFERGQSFMRFAILMPLLSLFLRGILDYMVTNARVMETVAAADLAAHAGAQEITFLPDGTLTATRGGDEESGLRVVGFEISAVIKHRRLVSIDAVIRAGGPESGRALAASKLM
jgi:hypothetical protein